MSQLVLEPAVRQLELLRSGEVSVRELVEAHLRQIDRLNPALNVFADFDPDRVALQDALAQIVALQLLVAR